MNSRSHAELIAEAEQAFAAARRLVDEQSAIVQQLERTGGCNSEAVDLLNNLRELLAARERRLARVRSWPSWERDDHYRVITQTMIPEHLKHFTLCPSCGRQMRHFANYEIYECRECRLFVNEKLKESDINNVNTSSSESAVL